MSELSWIDLAWPMCAAASLTLGAVHLFIWLSQKRHIANLLFAATAFAVAGMSLLELAMMNATTPQAYALLMKWAHIPVAVMIIGIVGFIHLHFRTGNRRLAIATCATRLACLAANFLTGVNLNFIAVVDLTFVPLSTGGTMAIPHETIANPWAALGSVNLLLFLAFFVTTLVEIRRRPASAQRRSALRIVGAMLAFFMISSPWTWAVMYGLVEGPLLFSPAFLVVLVVMGYELGGDMLRATSLARTLGATEESLQVSQRRIARVVEATNIGLWKWDIASGRCWLSPRALLLLNLEPSEGVDVATLRALVHPDDLAGVDDALSRCVSAAGEFACECRVVGDGGAPRWLDVRGQVEFDASGAPLRLEGMLLDITGRKQVEERLRKVVEQVPAAMVMFDSTGTITLANTQAERLLGLGSHELTGMAVRDIVPERHRAWLGRERVPDPWGAPLRSGEPGREAFVLRGDGTEVPVEIALSPIRLDTGEFVLLSMIDLTLRKRMEREAAVQRDELVHLSRVSVMSELSGSLAHELNQPLTAILSNAQASIRFLAHTPPNLEEVRGGLANVVDSAKRAGEVIRRMRALLRKERSEHRLLDLNEVVLDVLQLARIDLLNHNVDLVLQLEDDLPPVRGDKVQLQQVLLNLTINGNDAMKDVAHPRRITVATALLPEGMVEVAVTDVGKGIPEGEMERIFLPFVSSKPDGLGFGLAVCTTILQAHGGSLRAANNAGPGATMKIRLPVLDRLEVRG